MIEEEHERTIVSLAELFRLYPRLLQYERPRGKNAVTEKFDGMVKRLYLEGMTQTEIATRLGVGRMVVRHSLAVSGVKSDKRKKVRKVLRVYKEDLRFLRRRGISMTSLIRMAIKTLRDNESHD